MDNTPARKSMMKENFVDSKVEEQEKQIAELEAQCTALMTTLTRMLMMIVIFTSVILFMTREAWCQSNVYITWKWQATGSTPAGYKAYSCGGTCSEASPNWAPELDAGGSPVLFTSCQVSPCSASYLGQWPVDTTYSFRLTAYDDGGNESPPSNIITKTRELTLAAPTLDSIEIDELFINVQ